MEDSTALVGTPDIVPSFSEKGKKKACQQALLLFGILRMVGFGSGGLRANRIQNSTPGLMLVLFLAVLILIVVKNISTTGWNR